MIREKSDLIWPIKAVNQGQQYFVEHATIPHDSALGMHMFICTLSFDSHYPLHLGRDNDFPDQLCRQILKKINK